MIYVIEILSKQRQPGIWFKLRWTFSVYRDVESVKTITLNSCEYDWLFRGAQSEKKWRGILNPWNVCTVLQAYYFRSRMGLKIKEKFTEKSCDFLIPLSQRAIVKEKSNKSTVCPWNDTIFEFGIWRSLSWLSIVCIPTTIATFSLFHDCACISYKHTQYYILLPAAPASPSTTGSVGQVPA